MSLFLRRRHTTKNEYILHTYNKIKVKLRKCILCECNGLPDVMTVGCVDCVRNGLLYMDIVVKLHTCIFHIHIRCSLRKHWETPSSAKNQTVDPF